MGYTDNYVRVNGHGRSFVDEVTRVRLETAVLMAWMAWFQVPIPLKSRRAEVT